MGFLTNTAERVARLFGYVKAQDEDYVRQDLRGHQYQLNQLRYDGKIYNRKAIGGALEEVLEVAIGPAYALNPDRFPIHPFYLPFAEIVETYQYVLPGVYGGGIEIADQSDGDPAGDPVNKAILPVLKQLWVGSNFDTEKSKAIRWAANFGTVGMRTTVLPATASRDARVTMGVDHPSRLFNIEEDSEGNVTGVCLKYRQMQNFNTLAEPRWEPVDVEEVMTKDEFSLKYGRFQQTPDEARANTFGFTPYVILRHKDNGTLFGDWSYKGVETLVDRINWRVSRQDKSLDRHTNPKWFGTAGGGEPKEVVMGDEVMTFVKTEQGTPPPSLEALVAKIDHGAGQAFWAMLMEMSRSRQPEQNLNAIRLLANLSGDAIAQVLLPTAKAITDVRPAYIHAVKRLMQMGVSAGINAGVFDVGTGTGTAAAADTAYRDGHEDFAFKPMPAIPPTATQATAQATADQAENQAKLETATMQQAVGLPRIYSWQTLGITDKKLIAELQKQRDDEAQLPAEPGPADSANPGVKPTTTTAPRTPATPKEAGL